MSNGFYPKLREVQLDFGKIILPSPGDVMTADDDTYPVLMFSDLMQTPFQPVFGMVWVLPDSPVSGVLAFEQSRNNGKAQSEADTDDAYAVINLRTAAGNAANVTIVPGGRVVFSLETLTKDYLKVKLTNGARAVVTLAFWHAQATVYRSAVFRGGDGL